MKIFLEIYSIAVATAMLGKTKDEEIAEYLKDKNPKIIKAIKEMQPILMDFSLSDEVIMKKISQIFVENGLGEYK